MKRHNVFIVLFLIVFAPDVLRLCDLAGRSVRGNRHAPGRASPRAVCLSGGAWSPKFSLISARLSQLLRKRVQNLSFRFSRHSGGYFSLSWAPLPSSTKSYPNYCILTLSALWLLLATFSYPGPLCPPLRKPVSLRLLAQAPTSSPSNMKLLAHP